MPKEQISIHAPRTGSDACENRCDCKCTDFNPRSPHGERLHHKRFRQVAKNISIHAPRTGSDGRAQEEGGNAGYFNPRSPHGERRDDSFSAICSGHFNPRSPHGERLALAMWCVLNHGFQSTLPARGATISRTRSHWLHRRFQSTLPARGATPCTQISPLLDGFQSTLPARGATAVRGDNRRLWDFNPRSPHGERHPDVMLNQKFPIFQSTLPARGATDVLATYWETLKISIHAPRTGSDERKGGILQHFLISIHAPRTGSDGKRQRERLAECTFQSTLPARGATRPRGVGERVRPHFNPRSPHGERLAPSRIVDVTDVFQSTLPARGATALRLALLLLRKDFNPRSPHGERPSSAPLRHSMSEFQSTLPARGATP